jgi:hypothetical protein
MKWLSLIEEVARLVIALAALVSLIVTVAEIIRREVLRFFR